MFIFTSFPVYCSDDIELHVEVMVDHMGSSHFFYQIVTDDSTYTIPEVEGMALEKRIRRINAKRGDRAAANEMISFSLLCKPGEMH